jgi:hypothetical protein
MQGLATRVMAVRTAELDALALASRAGASEQQLEQVVLLGVGMDTRSWRLKVGGGPGMGARQVLPSRCALRPRLAALRSSSGGSSSGGSSGGSLTVRPARPPAAAVAAGHHRLRGGLAGHAGAAGGGVPGAAQADPAAPAAAADQYGCHGRGRPLVLHA